MRQARNVPESGRRRRRGRRGRGVGEEEEGAGPGDVGEGGVLRSHAAAALAKEEERSPDWRVEAAVAGAGILLGNFEKFRWCGREVDRERFTGEQRHFEFFGVLERRADLGLVGALMGSIEILIRPMPSRADKGLLHTKEVRSSVHILLHTVQSPAYLGPFGTA